jgi:hypothetical protein
MGKQTLTEKFYLWLSWKLPRLLIYYCGVRLIANATTCDEGKYQTFDEINIMDMLARWKVKE